VERGSGGEVNLSKKHGEGVTGVRTRTWRRVRGEVNLSKKHGEGVTGVRTTTWRRVRGEVDLSQTRRGGHGSEDNDLEKV